MDQFIARENIRHFCDRLETETDSKTRSLLHGLLIKEEDKLARRSETLREIDKLIAQVTACVNRQQALLISRQRDGHDTTEVVALLNSYSQTLFTFENQRRKVIAIQQSGV
jgi:hypothetical protein